MFAQRQTFWDSLLTVMASRERDWLLLLLQLLLTALANFTIGMTVAVFAFAFQLPAMLWSFKAGMVSLPAVQRSMPACPPALLLCWASSGREGARSPAHPTRLLFPAFLRSWAARRSLRRRC
jgi:hypothetical protein